MRASARTAAPSPPEKLIQFLSHSGRKVVRHRDVLLAPRLDRDCHHAIVADAAFALWSRWSTLINRERWHRITTPG
jgi:hypothetical protein